MPNFYRKKNYVVDRELKRNIKIIFKYQSRRFATRTFFKEICIEKKKIKVKKTFLKKG